MRPLPIFFAILISAALPLTVFAQYQVADIQPGLGSAFSVGKFASVGNVLFFFADDGTNGAELWRSDGTAPGTFMVRDINPGPGSSDSGFYYTQTLVVLGNTVFFPADDGVSGQELWKSDGSAVGTVQVMDINPGPGGSNIQQLTVIGGTLFFSADDGVHGGELWKSDGTTAGTVMVSDINPGATSSTPVLYAGIGNKLFFAANNGAAGEELWTSDGTTAGTTMVTDIRTGALGSLSNAVPLGTLFSSNFAVVGTTLFFRATNGLVGNELWKSDGTAAGTVMVSDINPGLQSSNPGNLLALGSRVFFRATDGVHGTELWTSDGTTAGTTMISDINPGTASSTPSSLMSMGSLLFFSADDGVLGRELWKFDTTTSAIGIVTDIGPGLDGIEAGANIEMFSVADNPRMMFHADDGVHGQELWISDGTPSGTYMLADINPGSATSWPWNFNRVGSLVFFVADDGQTGTELWAVPLSAFGGALAEPFGHGGPGTGGHVPKISAIGGPPVIGNGAFGVQVTTGLSNAPSPAYLFAHTVQTTLDLGGGYSVYLSLLPPLAQIPTTTDIAGFATINVGLPNNPALVGFQAFVQWAVVDPAGWNGFVSLSDGMQIVIGF